MKIKVLALVVIIVVVVALWNVPLPGQAAPAAYPPAQTPAAYPVQQGTLSVEFAAPPTAVSAPDPGVVVLLFAAGCIVPLAFVFGLVCGIFIYAFQTAQRLRTHDLTLDANGKVEWMKRV